MPERPAPRSRLLAAGGQAVIVGRPWAAELREGLPPGRESRLKRGASITLGPSRCSGIDCALIDVRLR